MENKFPRPTKDIIADEKNIVHYNYGDNWGISHNTYVNSEFLSVFTQYYLRKIPYFTKKGIPLIPEEIKYFQGKIIRLYMNHKNICKTNFKKWNLRLDKGEWDKVRGTIISELIEMRKKIDPWYARQMQIMCANKYTFKIGKQ